MKSLIESRMCSKHIIRVHSVDSLDKRGIMAKEKNEDVKRSSKGRRLVSFPYIIYFVLYILRTVNFGLEGKF